MQENLNHKTSLPKHSYGILGIRQHRIPCIVGIYPQEREQEQMLIVDAKVKIDFSLCLSSGQIRDTVDYVLLAEICTQLAQQNRYLLLEKLASDILKQFFERFPAVWAWVRIEKPSAIPSADCAYIEFERYGEKE